VIKTSRQGWLLLLHQIPPKPAYFRVKVWRRLHDLGAVAIKNSVYALPATDDAQEDFQWLLREIVEGGGEGSICEARFIDGLSDAQVTQLFQAARDAEYDEIAKEARVLAETLPAEPALLRERRGEIATQLARLRRRFGEVGAIDFFGAGGREIADGLLSAIEGRLDPVETTAARPGAHEFDKLTGRVWVTRAGIQVDRIASAWLIRRFIDPEARFKFVPAKGYVPEPGELRFDMFDAEYTHEGDLCTFEVLLDRAGYPDPALRAIAEIVHDLDLKDGKHARPETQGVGRLLAGVALAADDEQRLAQGAALLDVLYAGFRDAG
jgi:hypothetical protein